MSQSHSATRPTDYFAFQEYEARQAGSPLTFKGPLPENFKPIPDNYDTIAELIKGKFAMGVIDRKECSRQLQEHRKWRAEQRELERIEAEKAASLEWLEGAEELELEFV